MPYAKTLCVNYKQMDENKKIIKLLEKYSNNAILRSLVNLIPYIGGSIDALFSTRAQEISLKRLNKYFENLRTTFEHVNASKIDNDFLQSEEFYDLILQTSHSIAKSRSEDKIVLYSEILKDAVTREFKDPLSPDDLVNIIDDLSPNDVSFIKILSKYFTHQEARKGHGHFLFSSKDINKLFQQYSIEMLWIGLLRLERNNLIVRNTGLGNIKIEGYSYSDTPILMAIIKYLMRKNNNAQIE